MSAAVGHLPVIQAFWYGPSLGRIEQLSLASFVAHGHDVSLWCYQEPRGVPSGVALRDASEILAESEVFRYSGRRRYHNRGSLAGFANWFRYEMLFREGGIWVDADMVCLRPFDFGDEPVFAWEDDKAINVAVLGLPKGHRLARWMADLCQRPNKLVPYDSPRRIVEKLSRRFLEGDKRGNVQFGEYGPIGFTNAVKYFNMTGYAMPTSVFYPVHYWDWKQIFDPSLDLSGQLVGAHGLHLWNERMRQDPAFDKEAVHDPKCYFEQLWERYM